jgi:hypothetical protein
MAGYQHVKPEKLPFGYTFRLFDISEWVAFEGPPAIRTNLVKFTVFTLNHFYTPHLRRQRMSKEFCLLPSPILYYNTIHLWLLKVFYKDFGLLIGAIYGKTEAET